MALKNGMVCSNSSNLLVMTYKFYFIGLLLGRDSNNLKFCSSPYIPGESLIATDQGHCYMWNADGYVT